MQVQSLGWEDPCRQAWQPTPIFLPGEFHGQSSLVGYSPWGCKELDTTEATQHTCTHVGNRNAEINDYLRAEHLSCILLITPQWLSEAQVLLLYFTDEQEELFHNTYTHIIVLKIYKTDHFHLLGSMTRSIIHAVMQPPPSSELFIFPILYMLYP